jgi:hypothetical protein
MSKKRKRRCIKLDSTLRCASCNECKDEGMFDGNHDGADWYCINCVYKILPKKRFRKKWFTRDEYVETKNKDWSFATRNSLTAEFAAKLLNGLEKELFKLRNP